MHTGSRAISRAVRPLALRPGLAPGLPFQFGCTERIGSIVSTLDEQGGSLDGSTTGRLAVVGTRWLPGSAPAPLYDAALTLAAPYPCARPRPPSRAARAVYRMRSAGSLACTGWLRHSIAASPKCEQKDPRHEPTSTLFQTNRLSRAI